METHTPLSKKRRLGSLLAAYVVIVLIYAVVGLWTAQGATHHLETALDRMVPLQPAWVLVYAAVYLQALAPVCVVSDTRVLERTLAGYLSIYVVAVPLWLLYPVSMPREPIQIYDVWTYGIALVRSIDPPTNCFPSMHVAFATLAALVVRRHDPRAGTVLLGTAALITWSTLATKQHWAVDGLLGASIAWVADYLWLHRLSKDLFRPLPRYWHSVWIGIYMVAVLILMSGWWLGWVPLEFLQQGASAHS